MRTIYFELSFPKAAVTKVLQRVWPGVVWSRLSPTRFAALPEPPLPGPRWVRVSNRQCGICASDLTILNVHSDPRISVAALPSIKRFYLGHEVVSDVVETGPQVTTVLVGDRVVMDTRFTGPTCFSQEISPPCRHCVAGDYARCENQAQGGGPFGVGGGWGDGYTAHETEVFKIPDDLTDDQAVFVEPASVAARAVLRRIPQAGHHILVVGCGTLGLLTIRIARIVAPNVHITAMARYSHQAALARQLGANEVIADGDGYQEVARVTGAELYVGPFDNQTLLGGFDIIYDVVGTGATIKDSLRWARAGGTVVLVGISPVMVKTDLSPIWHQEVDLIGSVVHGVEEWHGYSVHGYDLVIGWMRDGLIPVDGLITHRFSLEDIQNAVAIASDKRNGAVKVVLETRSRSR
jgi:threonine dehydrogenase-like Zn-dependent dehydrogenase